MKHKIALLLAAALLFSLAACAKQEAPAAPQPAEAPAEEPAAEPAAEPEDALPPLESARIELSEDIYITTPAEADVSVDEETAAEYVNNTLLVFAAVGTDEAAVAALAADCGAEIAGAITELDTYQFRFSAAMTLSELEALAETLAAEPRVESAMPDYVFDSAEDAVPDDPWRAAGETCTCAACTCESCGCGNCGADCPCEICVCAACEGTGCTCVYWDSEHPAGRNWGMEAIHAPEAWEYLDQMSPISVGLVDVMMDSNHDDLNLCGVVNVSAVAALTSGINSLASNDHGTHVAGIMAATANNGIGVTGVCAVPDTKIYICNNWYKSSVSSLMSGISALITKYGVRVVNISEHTNPELCILAACDGNKDAQDRIRGQAESAAKILNRLLDRGYEFVLCVAAGNQNNKTYYRDSTAQFNSKMERIYGYTMDKGMFSGSAALVGADAQYNHYLNCITDERLRSRIIVVGSVGLGEDGSYYAAASSCTGSRVDIMAPGVKIYSTYYGNTYGNLGGTSMATPHVAGAAALLFAADSTLTGAEIKQILCDTADYTTAFTGVSAGLLQVDAAVEAVLPEPSPTAQDLLSMTFDEIAALPWEEFHFYDSFDQPGSLFAHAMLGYAALDFTFPDDASCPSVVRLSDLLNGAASLPATPAVRTGMTYDELSENLVLSDLEIAPLGGTDDVVTTAFCCPEAGILATFYFCGSDGSAVLTTAELSTFQP